MSSKIVIIFIATCLALAAAQQDQEDRGDTTADRYDDDQCEEGWSALDTKNASPFRCAKYFMDRLTYDEANSYCRANSPGSNGQLVVIQDKGTNRRLADIIRSVIRGPFPAWIGLRLNDPKEEDAERVWKWQNAGRLRGFINWAPDTPNNDKRGGGQDCAYFNDYRKEGSWNDFECNTLFQFVCQYEV